MKRLKTVIAVLLIASSFVSNANAQNNQGIPNQSGNPKLIAVINRANWCAVCKANEERFGH